MYITEFPQSASSSRGWFARIVLLCGVSLLFVFLFIVFRGIHNIFFHPLHKYPGPWLWIAFPTFRHIASVRGYLDGDLRRLHDKYGTVVRFSATELSFITAQAWRDIYGHGHQELPRSLGNGVPDILGGNVAVHARHRKALSHGFSEKALAKQEPLIIYYVNLLLEKLRDVAASGQKTDIVQWYTLTAFDMIGDLSFGASFEGLKNNQVHGWIKMIFQGIKMNVLIQIAQKYPMITKSVMKYMLVADLVQAQQAFVRETAMRKINNPGMAGRGDFMEAMQRHKGGPDGLSMDETVSNLTILIAAGSETTSSLLSGTTHLLLKNPHCMRRVTDEVRGAFEKEDDINFVNASSRLPYMLACLDEALRLYPPIPTGMQRIVPPGASVEISGHDIPPMTVVSVHQISAYTSSLNWTEPNSFLPERWLPAENTRFAHDNHATLQPFSVGPRSCLGRNLAYNELRLILARLLWNFDLELCTESENWIKKKSFTAWEKKPMFVKLRQRKMSEQ